MRCSTFTALLLTAVIGACTGSNGGPGVTDTCLDSTGASHGPCRVVRGRLKLPPADQLHLNQGGFQLAAVAFVATGAAPSSDGAQTTAADAGLAIDGSPTALDGALLPDTGSAAPPTDQVEPRLFFGPVFAHDAGSGQRPDAPFSLVVPCALSVNLLLQVPRGSGDTPGLWVAALRFPTEDGAAADATLVPRQPADLCGSKTNSLDLDQVELTLRQEGVLSSGEVTLGQGNSKNPLALLDTDGDGTDDLADADDDDDGTPDIADTDEQGDGIVDTAQTLEALADQDADGVPDLFQ